VSSSNCAVYLDGERLTAGVGGIAVDSVGSVGTAAVDSVGSVGTAAVDSVGSVGNAAVDSVGSAGTEAVDAAVGDGSAAGVGPFERCAVTTSVESAPTPEISATSHTLPARIKTPPTKNRARRLRVEEISSVMGNTAYRSRGS